MEFLDSENKRNRTIRLFVGYFLVAILIGLASLILVFLIQGYGYDPNKGVNRSGLVFIENKPESAKIYIDGKYEKDTDARLAFNEGKHDLLLKKDKYRDWKKSFTLEGGSVMYFSYPRLFPVDISVGITQVFSTPPVWVSQSPDKHWLLMQQKTNSSVLTVIDLLKPSDEPKLITVPTSQLDNTGVITPIEWADDNKHLLVSQTNGDSHTDYVIIDRENADQSLNITKKLRIPDNSIVNLKDKKYDKYYVLNKTNENLHSATLKDGINQKPIISGIVAYKAFADNLIMYVTYVNAKPEEAKVEVLNGQDKYILKDIPRSPNAKYLLDLAQYEKKWFYVVSSPIANKVLIYRNPLNRAKPNTNTVIAPQMSININEPQFISFSNNYRFISIQSGKNFIVYDADQSKFYKYQTPLEITPNQEAKWMDGYRMIAVSNSKINVFEFDGANKQTLVNSHPNYGVYFDKDYKNIFTIVQQIDGKTAFQTGKLVANN